MNTRKLFPGGEIEITSNELNFMPEANREGLNGIPDGLGEGVNMIVSGVDAIINAGSDVSVQDGFIFMNGEMLKVDAAVVPRTVGTDLYQFTKVTTEISPDGDRNFRDGTTHNVYEKNRAVPTNVAAITGLSVEGNTVIDVLKGLIQVQSDWTQADNSQPDFIKNKPLIINNLLQGKVNGIQVGTGGTVGTVEGGVTSAVVLNDTSGDLRIRVNFANIGTTSYHPILTIQSNNANWDLDNDVFCMVKNMTATSFEVLFRETVGNTQDLSLIITVIPLDLS